MDINQTAKYRAHFLTLNASISYAEKKKYGYNNRRTVFLNWQYHSFHAILLFSSYDLAPIDVTEFSNYIVLHEEFGSITEGMVFRTETTSGDS